MDNVETNVARVSSEQSPPIFRKVIGRTIYEVAVHFSQTSTETMEDKVKRLILNDISQPEEKNIINTLDNLNRAMWRYLAGRHGSFLQRTGMRRWKFTMTSIMTW